MVSMFIFFLFIPGIILLIPVLYCYFLYFAHLSDRYILYLFFLRLFLYLLHCQQQHLFMFCCSSSLLLAIRTISSQKVQVFFIDDLFVPIWLTWNTPSSVTVMNLRDSAIHICILSQLGVSTHNLILGVLYILDMVSTYSLSNSWLLSVSVITLRYLESKAFSKLLNASEALCDPLY